MLNFIWSERLDGFRRHQTTRRCCERKTVYAGGKLRYANATVVRAASDVAGDGGGGSANGADREFLRKAYGPQRPGGGSGGPVPEPQGPGAAYGPGEQPLFPPQDVVSDPLLSAAIYAAEDWRQLRELYSRTARRVDPLQLMEMTRRLAHLTGALYWPDDSPLPRIPPPGLEVPQLGDRDVEDIGALATTLCRATQVCLGDVYGLQQVAGLLQAFVSLGVAPPTSWLRAAELVALRTQREGDGHRATSVLLNELLLLASAFQRLSHVPDRSFVQLLAEVRPVEEIGGAAAARGVAARGAGSGGGGGEEDQEEAPAMVLVLTAPQLLTLSRAVLLWGMQPTTEWVDRFLQAVFSRVSRANRLSVGSGGGGGLSDDEAVELAEAEAALSVGGLATFLWAAMLLEARPADPEGIWMRELTKAALRRLRAVLAAPPVVLAETAGGPAASASPSAAETAAGGGGSALTEQDVGGVSLQDIASLLSALHQLPHNPGRELVNLSLQAAAAVQARTDPFGPAALAAASLGSPPPGDSLAAVLFLSAGFDHPQDDETRGSVVAMAQAAQDWMLRMAAAAGVRTAADSDGDGDGDDGAEQAEEETEEETEGEAVAGGLAAVRAAFSGRGMTQLLLALLRMGGRPSEEWLGAWAGGAIAVVRAAEAEAAGAGGAKALAFDLDQVTAVLATCARIGLGLPTALQRDLLRSLMEAQAAAAAAAAAAPPSSTASSSQQAGVSGPGAILPQGATRPGGGGGGAAGGGPAGGGLIRSLPQFRQLLDVVALQDSPLLPGWLETFVDLVEDFRLRLGSKELVAIIKTLGMFSNTIVADTPTRPQTPPAAARRSPPGVGASGGPGGGAGAAATGSGSGGGGASQPVVVRLPAAAERQQAGSASPSSSSPSAPSSPPSATDPAVLSAGWVKGLLEDLRIRGGLRGPRDLMDLTQVLGDLRAPAALMAYVEMFAVAMTGEDGTARTTPPPQTPPGPAAASRPGPGAAAAAAAPGRAPAGAGAGAQAPPLSNARAEAAKLAAGGAGAGAGVGGGALPSVARLRLKLQKQQQEAVDAKAAQAEATAREAADADAEEAAEEPALWAASWPAMLMAFAAAGHVPERRWWTRFAATTSPTLERLDPLQLASTTAAALSLSSRFAAAEEARGGREAGEHLLLPSADWHETAMVQIVEAIRICPMTMDEARTEAVRLLQEQRRRGRGEVAERPPGGAAEPPAAYDESGEPLTTEELEAAVQSTASALPSLLSQLTAPQVPLPSELLEVLEGVAGHVAEEAAAALAAKAEAEATAAGEAAAAAGTRPAVAREGADVDVDIDTVVYAQQIITLCMQALIASGYPVNAEWLQQVAPIMFFSRSEWGPAPGSDNGELSEQQLLVLPPEYLTTMTYLVGRNELELSQEQMSLILRTAARQATAGQLGGGELAALLSGLSGVAGAEERVVAAGEAELEVLMQTLASQAGRLSSKGLSETAVALLQLGLQLSPDPAALFRPAVQRWLPELSPAQVLAVVTAGGSLGLQPPSRELLGALSMQVGRLAASPDPLGPTAATEVGYEVLRWFPEVAPSDSQTYISRLNTGLQGLMSRLEEIAEPVAAKAALLLASAGVPPPGRTQEEIDAALAPLVSATEAGLPDYTNEQLSNAIMGLSLLGARLPQRWLETFKEVSRLLLPEADSRSLAYLVSGLADQGAEMDATFTAELWAAVRRQAAPPLRSFDLLSARVLLESAGKLGVRPDKGLMQAVLDCALLRYREAPDPSGLVELVQVLAAFGYVPTPGWAVEARGLLSPAMADLPPEVRASVAAFLQTALPRGITAA